MQCFFSPWNLPKNTKFIYFLSESCSPMRSLWHCDKQEIDDSHGLLMGSCLTPSVSAILRKPGTEWDVNAWQSFDEDMDKWKQRWFKKNVVRLIWVLAQLLIPTPQVCDTRKNFHFLRSDGSLWFSSSFFLLTLSYLGGEANADLCLSQSLECF